MAESSQLNRTYVPKEIIRKSSLKNHNSLLKTNEFEKTAGNPYIQFEPFQVKFNGYELSKPVTAKVRIINKAPIPQRVHILPPTEPGFSIKVNKIGPIAAGMSQNIMVTFLSDVYKYQYDVIKINTETDNFVVPVYAYPSIPRIREIFPKIIDFGTVEVNSSDSNIYPIENIVPLDFEFEFQYLKESPAFIITPIKGIIQANSIENIEITFVPLDKCTYSVDAVLFIKQFDFQPIKIRLMGSGKEKRISMRSTKRIKSSKLNPIGSKILEKQKSQVNQMSLTNLQPPGQQNYETLGLATNKKSFIRSKVSYPKLLKRNPNQTQMKNTQMLTLNDKMEGNVKKQNEKEYLSRFSRVGQLDKEKQVKFSQYLGDHPMSEEDLQFERSVFEQYANTRLRNLEDLCTQRVENELSNEGEVEYEKYVRRDFKWDMNKNDELKLRKEKLQTFMNAGSKIIEKYRLVKRLNKIKQFLQGCYTREDVAKKVEEDYQKSLDSKNQGDKKITEKLTFDLYCLEPTSFEMQFNEEGQSFNKLFDTQGSPDFDDYAVINEVKPHETQRMNYNNFSFPPDFVNLDKFIPPIRRSGEEELPLRSSTLPKVETYPSTSLYDLQLQMPTHHFISNNFSINRYKQMNPNDEKTSEYLCNSKMDSVQDQFEGWSKGDYEVLKIKFQRNLGCQYSGISVFKSNDSHDIGFLGELGSTLPKEIGMKQLEKDDIIQEEDSDEEKLNEIAAGKGEQYLQTLEQGVAKATEAREEGKKFQSFERKLYETVDRNLMESKMSLITKPIDKIQGINKWAEKEVEKLLI